MTAYFDNSATTKVCPEAAAAVMAAMTDTYGNPSSGHREGRAAAALLRESREKVAAALGAEPGEIYFTSGGTESDNWALRGAAYLSRHHLGNIVTGAAEHDAIRNTAGALEAQGWKIRRLAPDSAGRVTPQQVMEAVDDGTALVSLMLVNNETGAVSPIEEIFRQVRRSHPKVLLHTDAVQGFLKVPFSAGKLGADLISISSHKIHGPKGVGALYIRKGLRFPQLLTGGSQEAGLRPGTEPLPAIAGFGEAARVGWECFQSSAEHMSSLREHIVSGLRERFPQAVVIGEGDAPHILSISLPGYGSEVLMNVLDAAGICVSKSSACRRGARSHVLEAMGLPPKVVDGALRVSLSRFSTLQEADYFLSVLEEAAGRLRTKK